MKLSKAQRRILRLLEKGQPMDIYDLAEAAHRMSKAVFSDCAALKAGHLIEWMYPEDEIALSNAGRAAVKDTTHAE